jgi:hypothetical protein
LGLLTNDEITASATGRILCEGRSSIHKERCWNVRLRNRLLGIGSLALLWGVGWDSAAQSETRPERVHPLIAAAQMRADIHRVRQLGLSQDRSAVPELIRILEASLDDTDILSIVIA